MPDPVRHLFREVPHYEWLYRVRLSWVFNDRIYEALHKDPKWVHPERSINAKNEGHREVFTRYINEELGDRPDLLEKVIPHVPAVRQAHADRQRLVQVLRNPKVKLVDCQVSRRSRAGPSTSRTARSTRSTSW